MTWLPNAPADLIAFAVASLAVVTSPGPDTMLILRNTANGGRATGLATVAGVQIGLAVHTAAIILGLSVIVASSNFLFTTVAIVGALYLAWLGVQSFLGTAIGFGGGVDAPRIAPWQGCRDAIVTNVLNPKVILLFIAMMPNFVRVEAGRVALQLVVLGVLLIFINIVWQVGLVALVETARRWLDRPAVQKWVSWISGTVLIVIALYMISSHLVL